MTPIARAYFRLPFAAFALVTALGTTASYLLIISVGARVLEPELGIVPVVLLFPAWLLFTFGAIHARQRALKSMGPDESSRSAQV